eukprot:gnl/TRDRNA2_/TRDRNA2_154975_c1_seq1.p1 gnl/TRDRNA2_/TRDRNA2_154975_c1~~gnl/TRDRNA2_/TRDRNA2_154975_c1_seq1.p1  ORF type:complete len:569 (+),score=90.15 gnl/TRDRNA2_/TRDRNA2_154975_c1_seq1:132-1709(+)
MAPADTSMDEVCIPAVCETPSDPANGKLTKVGPDAQGTFYTLECSPGYMPDQTRLSFTACQATGELTTLPRCVSDPGCEGERYEYWTVAGATSPGNCSELMMTGQTCRLECDEGRVPTGQLTCDGAALNEEGRGTLVGTFHCLEPGEYVSEKIDILSSAITVAVNFTGVRWDTRRKIASKSLSAALTVDEKLFSKVEVSQVTNENGRRLAKETARRLQSSEFEFAYEVILPDGMETFAITMRAARLAEPGNSQNAFLDAFPEDIPVDRDSIKVTQAPRTVASVRVKDVAGKVIAPEPSDARPPKTTTTPLEIVYELREQEDRVGLFIGIGIGVFVVVTLLGGSIWLGCKKLRKSYQAEADKFKSPAEKKKQREEEEKRRLKKFQSKSAMGSAVFQAGQTQTQRSSTASAPAPTDQAATQNPDLEAGKEQQPQAAQPEQQGGQQQSAQEAPASSAAEPPQAQATQPAEGAGVGLDAPVAAPSALASVDRPNSIDKKSMTVSFALGDADAPGGQAAAAEPQQEHNQV